MSLVRAGKLLLCRNDRVRSTGLVRAIFKKKKKNNKLTEKNNTHGFNNIRKTKRIDDEFR